jgi:hypothetical protein
MRCVAVATSFPPEALADVGADLVRTTIAEIGFDDLAITGSTSLQ